MKLKAHYKDREKKLKEKKICLENWLIKHGFPKKLSYHWNINRTYEYEIFEINEEISQNKSQKNPNLLKGEQKALVELRERDNIVIVHVNKRGAVVITDAINYIEQSENF